MSHVFLALSLTIAVAPACSAAGSSFTIGPYRLEFYAVDASGTSIANATLDWLWFGDVGTGEHHLFWGANAACFTSYRVRGRVAGAAAVIKTASYF